jgi:hypothetical protein
MAGTRRQTQTTTLYAKVAKEREYKQGRLSILGCGLLKKRGRGFFKLHQNQRPPHNCLQANE